MARARTACRDARRQFQRCGVCGGRELMAHVLELCPACRQAPEERQLPPGCTCAVVWVTPVPLLRGQVLLEVCLACQAVRGPRCPVCRRRAWARAGRLFCYHCGYHRR